MPCSIYNPQYFNGTNPLFVDGQAQVLNYLRKLFLVHPVVNQIYVAFAELTSVCTSNGITSGIVTKSVHHPPCCLTLQKWNDSWGSHPTNTVMYGNVSHSQHFHFALIFHIAHHSLDEWYTEWCTQYWVHTADIEINWRLIQKLYLKLLPHPLKKA